MKARLNLWEFLAALLDLRVEGCSSARARLLVKHGITEEEFNAMRKACAQGRFRIR